jgi:hypothetical protein
MKLTDLRVGNRSLNLDSYGLVAGTYKVFVKMVAKPGILNRMSPAATYTVGTGGTTTPAPAPSPVAAVTITSPTNNYPNAGQAIRVKAYATSNNTISAMRILVDGVSAVTINNVTSVDQWVHGSVGSWHSIQVLAWTNHAWVQSSTVKVFVSY